MRLTVLKLLENSRYVQSSRTPLSVASSAVDMPNIRTTAVSLQFLVDITKVCKRLLQYFGRHAKVCDVRYRFITNPTG